MTSYRRGLGLALILFGAIPTWPAWAAPAPKLTGIVRLEDRKRALLELTEEFRPGALLTRKPILTEGERDGNYALMAIDERTARVSLRFEPTGELFELKLDQPPGEELANRTLNFQSADLLQVLEIYQAVSGRTVIRSSGLASLRLDLKSGASLANTETASMLTDALGEKGLLFEPMADKFVFLIPAGQEKALAAIPGPPTTKAGSGEEIFGAGMIKFQDSDLLQVLDIYQDLTGRTVLRPEGGRAK